ncbi:S1 family peptidase [Corynebacterium felinum]|uniref:S1 family peptidase n=1 Tax=Corynebacterium felinum TaxID=131318 RepID=UPI0023F8FDA0|nr:S1 family peptidase [Corynebacterium felinum]MDF5821105.1 S1 family peptidase [Corynebacterium felinum]WJY94329.1 hypothetical protein CFELI_03445 [Corynebacterium felinum]
MRTKSITRTVFSSAIIGGLLLGQAPSAWAFTLPTPSETLQQLQQGGVQLHKIDPAFINDADAAVALVNADIARAVEKQNQVIAEYNSYAGEKGLPKITETAKPFEFGDETLKKVGDEYRPIVEGPNYRWKNDPFSQFMALKNGPVLQRVPVSFFDAPPTPLNSIFTERDGNSLYGPSTPVYVGKNQLCTITATGVDDQGRKVAITAGHCGKVGSQVVSADSWRVGRSGTVVAHGQNGLDYSVIELGSNAQITRSYNGVTVDEIGGVPGSFQTVCKTGVATGHTCGVVWVADKKTNLSQVCATAGDSGAPVMAGNRLVGMVSGGLVPDYNLSCRTPLQGAAFQPTISTSMDAVLADINQRGGVGAGFRLPES